MMHGAPFILLVDDRSARRRRDRRLSSCWSHEHLSVKMASMTATHHDRDAPLVLHERCEGEYSGTWIYWC